MAQPRLVMGMFILSLTLCSRNTDDCGSSYGRQLAAEFLVPGVLVVTVGIAMIVTGGTTVDADVAPGLALGGGVRLGGRGLTF